MTGKEGGETEGKAVFQLLRPLCVEVMSTPSVETLSRLQAGLASLPHTPSSIPPHLVTYLTLPLRAAIKRAGSSNERLLESSLLTMADILSRVENMDVWELFHDMFSFTCMLLDEKMAKETGLVGVSEEVQMACLKLLKELFLCSTSNLHQRLFPQLVPLGHCISALLHCATTSHSHSLIREALATLCALTDLNTTPLLTALRLRTSSGDLSDLTEPVGSYLRLMRESVGVDKCEKGRVLASFLPGVVMGVAKLLTSDVTMVESVLTLGLLTWTQYVVLVMGGAEGVELVQEGEGPVQLVHRTEKWYEETATKLNVLIQRMCVLVTSEAWKVRVQLVGVAHTILHHCSESLEVCLPQLLEILVTLSHDSYPQVVLTARAALQQFPGGGSGLSSLLSQQLHALVSSLPRLIRQHDDSKKVVTLQLLAGYLALSGGHVDLMVHSLPHLSCLIQALVQTLTLQQQGPHNVVVARSLPGLDPASLPAKPLPLHHTHFSSDKVASLLGEVCQLLGCHGDLTILMDYVLDQCHAHSHLRCEYLLLLALVLRGGKGCGQDKATPLRANELMVLIEGVVTRLMLPDVWSCDPTTTVNSDLYSFLLLYVIFTCVHVLEVNFDPLLQQSIYLLMQKLGDTNVGVANAAMATLQAVCNFCGYDAVSSLIGRNADYLVHATSVHLRHAPTSNSQHAEAIQVLGAVMSHGNEEVCHLMKDCIQDLLVALDTRQLAPPLVWAGLQTLARSCGCWISRRERVEREGPVGVVSAAEEEEEAGDREDVGIEAIAEYFLQYHKNRDQEAEGGGVGQEEEQGAGQQEEESYSQDCPLPAVEQLCVEVMRRCGHHMSHDSPSVRLVVMETLEYCMQALQHEKLTLYPEVHTVWPALLPRLKDHTPSVSRRAWQVVGCVCKVCGDFVRRRVLERVWPLLISSLETSAPLTANSDPLYNQSAKCKLQCVLLESVGSIAASLSLPPAALETGGVACIPYLGRDQPRPLQEAASGTFRHLIRLDPHCMWLLLQQVAPPTDATPTHPCLKPYKFPGHPDAAKYAENVAPLKSLTFDVM